MNDSSSLSAAMEDYLEAIFHLEQAEGAAKPQKIADRIEVHKSTVTTALRNLSQAGLVNYAPYQAVTLTQAGRQVAWEVVSRHRGLYQFLRGVLGLPEDEAQQSACRMEHAVSSQTVHRLVELGEFLEYCRGNSQWRECFERFSANRQQEKTSVQSEPAAHGENANPPEHDGTARADSPGTRAVCDARESCHTHENKKTID